MATRRRPTCGRFGRAGVLALLVLGVAAPAITQGALAATTYGIAVITAPTEVGASQWIQIQLTTYWQSDHTQAPNVTVSARILEDPTSAVVKGASDVEGHLSLSVASPQAGGRPYNVSVVALDASGQVASEPVLIPVYVRPAPDPSAGNTPQTINRFSPGLQIAMVIGGIAGASTFLIGLLFARQRKKGAFRPERQP